MWSVGCVEHRTVTLLKQLGTSGWKLRSREVQDLFWTFILTQVTSVQHPPTARVCSFLKEWWQTGPTSPNTCEFLLFQLEFLFNTEPIPWQLAGASTCFSVLCSHHSFAYLGYNPRTFTQHVPLFPTSFQRVLQVWCHASTAALQPTHAETGSRWDAAVQKRFPWQCRPHCVVLKSNDELQYQRRQNKRSGRYF